MIFCLAVHLLELQNHFQYQHQALFWGDLLYGQR